MSKLLCYLSNISVSQEFIGHLYTYVHVKSQFSTLRKHEYLMIKSKDFPTTKCNIVSRLKITQKQTTILSCLCEMKKKNDREINKVIQFIIEQWRC